MEKLYLTLSNKLGCKLEKENENSFIAVIEINDQKNSNSFYISKHYFCFAKIVA